MTAGTALGAVITTAGAPASLQAQGLSGKLALAPEEFADPRNVVLRATVAESRTLKSQSDGLITRFDCIPGGVWKSGTVQMWVDGEPLVSLTLDAPLWRPLSIGAEGEDVAALQKELTRLGFPAEDDGEFGWETAEALSGMWAAIGRDDKEDIAPADTVWLPAAEATINSCEVDAGSPAVSGDPIAELPPAAAMIGLSTVPEGLVAGERELAIGDVVAPVDMDTGDVAKESLASILASPEFQAFTQSGGDGQLTATLRLSTPIEIATAPASAVVIDGELECVVAGRKTIPVDVVASSLGSSILKFSSEIPSSIELTPSGGARCS
ncbi:peptidoglycan-binding protein [Agromyces sp. NPDC058104]|uniref:peptidoglycan-binding domain-containing protein n=1 Tax=Agromyces sp. NPDC058104 TaxID=3346342 RepID=UPI0036DB3553